MVDTIVSRLTKKQTKLALGLFYALDSILYYLAHCQIW